MSAEQDLPHEQVGKWIEKTTQAVEVIPHINYGKGIVDLETIHRHARQVVHDRLCGMNCARLAVLDGVVLDALCKTGCAG